MTPKVEEKSLVGQDTDADKYLKKIAPKKGQPGAGCPTTPLRPGCWTITRNSRMLWEAVRRLEEISHNGQAGRRTRSTHRAQAGAQTWPSQDAAAAAAAVPVSSGENAVCQPRPTGTCRRPRLLTACMGPD